jgi:ABC-type Fe3+-hydroxamate transport system substrate-binding protein
VILDCDENRREDADALEKAGIKTLSVFPKTIDDSVNMLRAFGELFAVEGQANDWIKEIEGRRKHLHPLRYRTLILIWRSPYMTINHDTYVHSAAQMFGFDNVFSKHPDRYPRLTSEQIHTSEAECVLFPDEPYPFREKHLNIFKEEFPQLMAVQSNRLLMFDGSYLAWHGYGTLRALREFA